MLSRKRIHYSCEGEIEKSVPRDLRLPSLGKPRDATNVNVDPRNGFFDPTLTLMKDSYNLFLFVLSMMVVLLVMFCLCS